MGLEEAIRQTIQYAAKYGVDLTWEEVKERLISPKNYELLITNYEFKKKK